MASLVIRKFLYLVIALVLYGLLAVQLVHCQTDTPEGWRLLVPVPAHITDFSVDEEGNLLVLDRQNRTLKRWLVGFDYDSSLTIGGAGLGTESFQQPLKILALNRQESWLLDGMNRRLTLFSFNLKPIRSVDFLDLDGGPGSGQIPHQLSPQSFTVSGTGEVFVLNRDDNQIYKFDRFGRLESVFGGTSYGQGSLFSPQDIFLTANHYICVPDGSDGRLMVFDNFGVFRYAVDFPAPYPLGYCAAGNEIMGWHPEGLISYERNTAKFTPKPTPPQLGTVRAAWVNRSKHLYVLAGEGIWQLIP
jgi:hypothetical protein